MSGGQSYTAEEIAKLLKISKLTVYELIKKGELPGYRVGKMMRVDEIDFEAFKNRAKGRPVTKAASAVSEGVPTARAAGSLVITGQDVSLDLLSARLERSGEGLRPLRSYTGSMDSLIAMYRGEADIVSTHLLDGDTGTYNLPYIRRLLSGLPLIVVHLHSRSAGFYVQPGNPLGLRAWADLARPGLRIVNRERGSGARVLLDEQLRLHGIAGRTIAGYDREEGSHLAVAGQVAAGAADAGVGIEKAAQLIGRVAFIPLIRESYDLVMVRSAPNEPWISAALGILRDPAFHAELAALGHDPSDTGKVLYEC